MIQGPVTSLQPRVHPIHMDRVHCFRRMQRGLVGMQSAVRQVRACPPSTRATFRPHPCRQPALCSGRRNDDGVTALPGRAKRWRPTCSWRWLVARLGGVELQ